MTVAVVTAWVDHPELREDYFDAIEMGPAPDELIVVDNGSTPPLGFATIRNEANRGFCPASNQGLTAATSDVCVFLNNDVWAREVGWLERLVDEVGPGILAGARLRSDYHCVVDGIVMPYLDGWCLAGMREELLELGGFDETLAEPAYYSDNLLCLEARAAGLALREVQIGLVHKEGQTIRPDTNQNAKPAGLANRRRYEHRVRELLALTTTKGAS